MTLIRRLISTLILALLIAINVGAADNRSPRVSSSDLITPSQLNSELPAVKAGKIVLIQVGFHTMYKMGHIPGSQYAGAAAKRRGLGRLEKACGQASPQPEDRHLLRMLSVGRLPQHSPRLPSSEGDGILKPQGARHPRKARRRLDGERISNCERGVKAILDFGFSILD